MKRKGLEAVSAGTASVVTRSPLIERKNSETSSPFSVFSPFSPSTTPTWEETRDSVDKLLLQFEGPNASKDTAVLKDNTNIIHKLEENVELLKSKSSKIKNEIKMRIQDTSKSLEEESDSLRLQSDHFNQKRRETDKIKSEIEALVNTEIDLKMKIDQHKRDASEEVGQIDEVEEEKKAEVYRLQQHISLLALVSGIKWDYDCVHSIAGEVEVPSKGKQVRFEIDKEKYSVYEIANMLWDKIGS